MKCLILLGLVAVAASAAVGYHGDGYHDNHHGGYRAGLTAVHDGYAAPYSNDNRQKQVNYIAEHIGAGTGTARFDGVPGTRYNFPYNSYDNGHHGYNGGYNNGHHGYNSYNDGHHGYNAYNDGHHGYNTYNDAY